MATAAFSVTDTGLTDPDGLVVLAVRGRGISGHVAVRLRHREPDYHSGFGGWYLDIRLSPRLTGDRSPREEYTSVHRRDYRGYLSVVAESESHPAPTASGRHRRWARSPSSRCTAATRATTPAPPTPR